MNLEAALQEQEEQVDALIKSANKYVSALKTWKKACHLGHIGNLQKASTQATDLVFALTDPTADAKAAWTFDVRSYLESDAWRKELQEMGGAVGLRILEENDTLISSPVILRSQPGQNRLVIGRTGWPTIRPQVMVAELKKLREKAGSANSQEFVDSLYAVYEYLKKGGLSYARFIDIYNLFSMTPGWKKENPSAAFGQAIYALHLSEIQGTRGGKIYDMIYPSADAKEKDIFTVFSEDGKPIRYYGIRFSG